MSFHPWSRLVAWAALGLMHLGILLVLDFADLSLGMLMVHLFTFDPEWLSAAGMRGRRGGGESRSETGAAVAVHPNEGGSADILVGIVHRITFRDQIAFPHRADRNVRAPPKSFVMHPARCERKNQLTRPLNGTRSRAVTGTMNLRLLLSVLLQGAAVGV